MWFIVWFITEFPIFIGLPEMEDKGIKERPDNNAWPGSAYNSACVQRIIIPGNKRQSRT